MKKYQILYPVVCGCVDMKGKNVVNQIGWQGWKEDKADNWEKLKCDLCGLYYEKSGGKKIFEKDFE